MVQTQALWTIDELGTQVALALSIDYEGVSSSRVRDIPDRRTIRYYTTLGLLDRAAEMRGRTALYGRRHLLQLVAIKRLQTRGLPLVEIQQKLLGLNDTALARLARVPSDLETSGAEPVLASSLTEREKFWSAPPGPVSNQETNSEPPPPALLQGIRLGEDVTLLLAAARPVDEDDLQAIRAVAATLLKLLKTRRLLGPRNERETS
jgi:DNA-binding transcriptional MerR regulator